METIKDADIARLWSEYFRKRRYDADAEGYCLRLALQIVEKAQLTPMNSDGAAQFEDRVKHLGISKEELFQVLADAGISH